MKKLILPIILSGFLFTACGLVQIQDWVYSDYERIVLVCDCGNSRWYGANDLEMEIRCLTEEEILERRQFVEKSIIKTLVSTIESFDNINKAVISVEHIDEAERVVEVLLDAGQDSLTEEQKTGITLMVHNSFARRYNITVNINY